MLAHLVLFGYLAQVVPVLRTPRYAPEPDVQLDLAPVPVGSVAAPSPFAAPRRARAPASTAERSTLVPNARRPLRDTPPPRATVAARPAPSRPAAAAPASPPSAPTASIPTGGARGAAGQAAAPAGGGRNSESAGDEDARDGVRAFLRATVGCSHEDFANLTAQERAACAVRLARDARAVQNARVDPLSARDRTYFDALRDADQAARNRRMPGYGCSLVGKPQDAGGCALQGSSAGTQGLGATHP